MVIMIFRIRLCLRVPRHFLRENRFPVPDRRNLIITGAEIESDPAACQMAAGGQLEFPGGWDLGCRCDDDLKFLTVRLGHQLVVESPRAARRVGFADIFANRGRAADREFPSAPRPEQGFDGALNVLKGGGVGGGADREFETRHPVAFAGECQYQRNRLAERLHIPAVGHHCREITGIKWGRNS